MKITTTHKIFKALLERNIYVTSQQLAQMFSISVRSVKSYMDKVESLCIQHDLILCKVKGKGYLIDAPFEHKLSISANFYIEKKEYSSIDSKRCYTLYLLLIENRELFIYDLEIIFHLSRTSIKPIIDACREWLKIYNITLFHDRKKGLYISSGEKRLRLAISHLIFEIQDFAGNEEFSDLLKLINNHMDNDDILLVTQFVDYFIFDKELFVSEYEKRQLVTYFIVSLIRVRNGNFVSMPEYKINIINKNIASSYLTDLHNDFKQKFNLDLISNEQIYFLVMFLSSSTFDININNKELLLFLDFPDSCFIQVKNCLLSYFNLSESSILSFLDYYRALLTKETLYGVYDNNPTHDDYYPLSMHKFSIIKEVVLEIEQLSNQYCDIHYHSRFIHNLCYALHYFLEKEKKLLKTLLIHDCNNYEYINLVKIITTKLPCISITKIIQTSELNDEEYYNYDLILTTQPFSLCSEKSLIISKLPKENELICLYNQIIHLYEINNLNNLVKNPIKYQNLIFKNI